MCSAGATRADQRERDPARHAATHRGHADLRCGGVAPIRVKCPASGRYGAPRTRVTGAATLHRQRSGTPARRSASGTLGYLRKRAVADPVPQGEEPPQVPHGPPHQGTPACPARAGHRR